MPVWVRIIEDRSDYPGVVDPLFDLVEESRRLFPGDIVKFPAEVAHKLVSEGKAEYYDT